MERGVFTLPLVPSHQGRGDARKESMAVEINEPIKVAVVFSRGEIRPVWFGWNGRQIRIKETTFTWKTYEGSARILHFSVTDGEGVYEIVYNVESLGWRLMIADCGLRNERQGKENAD